MFSSSLLGRFVLSTRYPTLTLKMLARDFKVPMSGSILPRSYLLMVCWDKPSFSANLN